VLRVGSHTVRPLFEQLGVKHRGYSKNLQRMIVDFGAESSFAKSAERLWMHHQLSVSASCIRKITLGHACAIRHLQDPPTTRGALPAQGAEIIVTEMDGSMLPMVECKAGTQGDRRKSRHCHWQEVRLCAARVPGQSAAFYGVSGGGSVAEAGNQWSSTVAKANWGLNTQLHVVCDGASWIHEQCDQCLGKQATFLLDFYHACDYLAAATDPAATHKRWFEVQKNRLKTNHPERVLTALEPFLETETTDSSSAPVRAAYRYLSNRMDQLDYKTAIERGLPIGSGMIEGGHRHVLQNRLKLSGAWWKKKNVIDMANLRVCRANNEENQYWQNLKAVA
jgi:hypothetical protein